MNHFHSLRSSEQIHDIATATRTEPEFRTISDRNLFSKMSIPDMVDDKTILRMPSIQRLETAAGRFQNWLDSKLRIGTLTAITKSSELDEDLQWLQDKAFEFQKFYDAETIEYVCNIFKKKWFHDKQLSASQREAKFKEFEDFEHASPAII